MSTHKNRVLEFPCWIDDVVYVLIDGLSFPARRRVVEIHIDKKGLITFTVRNERTGEESRYYLWQFDHEIFTDLDRAKEAVRKGKEYKS